MSGCCITFDSKYWNLAMSQLRSYSFHSPCHDWRSTPPPCRWSDWHKAAYKASIGKYRHWRDRLTEAYMASKATRCTAAPLLIVGNNRSPLLLRSSYLIAKDAHAKDNLYSRYLNCQMKILSWNSLVDIVQCPMSIHPCHASPTPTIQHYSSSST